VPHGPLHLLLDSTGLKLFGQGEWQAEKHGRARRSWRKLHLALDAETGEVAASTLTGNDADDAGQMPDLLGQVEGEIASIAADGACDGEPVYQAVDGRQPGRPPTVIIPPRSSGVPGTQADTPPSQRDRHIQLIRDQGRLHAASRHVPPGDRFATAWQKVTGYGRRSLAETGIGRYKAPIGPRLRARTLPAQQGEVATAVEVLDRLIRTAKPVSVRSV
jgi:hypothetical protein